MCYTQELKKVIHTITWCQGELEQAQSLNYITSKHSTLKDFTQKIWLQGMWKTLNRL